MKIEAVIFDLDGVLVSTDRLHCRAWKKLADELKIDFDEKTGDRIRGVSRMDSLEIVLENYHGAELNRMEKKRLADKKNKIYRELLSSMTPEDVRKETRYTLAEIKKRGYKIALGSSSKNAGFILEQVDLADVFDAISDGNHIIRSKPNPEVFLKAAEFLHIVPEKCLVVEDAQAGIEAGIAGGMKTAAIGEAVNCGQADYKLEQVEDLLDFL